MPKQTKQVLVEVVRREDRQKKKKKKKARPRKSGNSESVKIGRVAAMVADPCGPFLVGDSYTRMEGALSRFHESTTLTGVASTAATCGYILWCPDYSPSQYIADGIYHTNMFGFAHAVSNYAVINNTLSPYGSGNIADFVAGTSMVTSAFIPDPAAAWNSSELISDTRCLSACLRLTPTGKLMDVSGQVALLTGVTLDMLLQSNHTVDDWFDYSSDTRAIARDGMEVRYRPTAATAFFRNQEQGAAHLKLGSATAGSESAESLTPTFFGIAWRGVDNSVGHPFVLDYVKNTESRITPFFGQAHAPPRTISEVDYIKPALETLDRVAPEWQFAMKDTMDQVITEVSLGARSVGKTLARRAVGGILTGLKSGWGPKQRLLKTEL